MNRIQLKAKMDAKVANKTLGKLIGDDSYDIIVAGTAAVYKPDGTLLCKLVKRAFETATLDQARDALRHLKRYGSDNRGKYAGMPRVTRRKADGTLSKTSAARNVASAIIGFFDRSPRMPFCRQTAFTANEVDRWTTILPMAQRMSELFRLHVPERWRAQHRTSQGTSPDFVIEDTVFTTMTVNNSVRAAVHRDKGDLDAGFGCMNILRGGPWTGGLLVFPEFRTAVQLDEGDAIFFDPHELHANTNFDGLDEDDGDYRVSCVYYYRTKMQECGSAKSELQLARDR
jgi:hypothetical protein